MEKITCLKIMVSQIEILVKKEIHFKNFENLKYLIVEEELWNLELEEDQSDENEFDNSLFNRSFLIFFYYLSKVCFFRTS